jgi:hypothetical protein
MKFEIYCATSKTLDWLQTALHNILAFTVCMPKQETCPKRKVQAAKKEERLFVTEFWVFRSVCSDKVV